MLRDEMEERNKEVFEDGTYADVSKGFWRAAWLGEVI